MSRWIQMFSRLGTAFLDWLAAEFEALASDLRGSGRELIRGVLLLATAAMVSFFAVGALTAAAIAALSLFMPVWAAALSVGVLLILKALVLLWVGSRILGRIENPATTFSRRWTDQEDYWRNRILEDSSAVEGENDLIP